MNRNHFHINSGFNDDIMGLELESDFDIDRAWEEFVEYERIRREDERASSHTSRVGRRPRSRVDVFGDDAYEQF